MHDKNGTEVKAGDVVTIEAVVTDAQATPDHYNLSLATVEPMHPGSDKTCLCLNARQVLLIKRTAAALVMCAALWLAGCSSTPATVAIKSEGVVVVTADTAMNLWANYVRAGNATQAEVDRVKSAYTGYYDAQQIAKAALELWVSSGSTNDLATSARAQHAASQAEQDLVALVQGLVAPGK